MEIEKELVVGFLRQQGQDARADEAMAVLPDPVDTTTDAGTLHQLGVDIDDLTEPGMMG